MAITFKQVSHIYSPDMPYAFKALKGIDLTLSPGKITGIIGETGSGKSTLIQHLNGLLLPDEGSLDIEGFIIKADEKPKGLKALRQKVGLVFQFSEYQLFEETVLKDVSFGPQNFNDDEATAIRKAKRALALVGIGPEYYEQSPLELSGGQKRRVAIAGILAMDPDILVLDEPTSGLDPQGSEALLTLLKKLNREYHKTIIIVTHDNEIAYHFCDDLVLLKDGEVAYRGSSKDYFARIEDPSRLPMDLKFIKELEKQGFRFKANDLEGVIKELSKVVKHG